MLGSLFRHYRYNRIVQTEEMVIRVGFLTKYFEVCTKTPMRKPPPHAPHSPRATFTGLHSMLPLSVYMLLLTYSIYCTSSLITSSSLRDSPIFCHAIRIHDDRDVSQQKLTDTSVAINPWNQPLSKRSARAKNGRMRRERIRRKFRMNKAKSRVLGKKKAEPIYVNNKTSTPFYRRWVRKASEIYRKLRMFGKQAALQASYNPVFQLLTGKNAEQRAVLNRRAWHIPLSWKLIRASIMKPQETPLTNDVLPTSFKNKVPVFKCRQKRLNQKLSLLDKQLETPLQEGKSVVNSALELSSSELANYLKKNALVFDDATITQAATLEKLRQLRNDDIPDLRIVIMQWNAELLLVEVTDIMSSIVLGEIKEIDVFLVFLQENNKYDTETYAKVKNAVIEALNLRSYSDDDEPMMGEWQLLSTDTAEASGVNMNNDKGTVIRKAILEPNTQSWMGFRRKAVEISEVKSCQHCFMDGKTKTEKGFIGVSFLWNNKRIGAVGKTTKIIFYVLVCCINLCIPDTVK
eukprot:GHVQ01017745.1.p1 GENE.GHVQ01017745.1~~GHVQ01017745.1.p1  ORF type:complete len:518 (+),score=51.39 GHVQ01017745.1:139-1692(+)